MRITASLSHGKTLYRNEKGGQVKPDSDGPNALELLLMAVAGCSGAVLGGVLEREGYKPDRVEISVAGEWAQNPRRFGTIKVAYDIHCPGLSEEKMQKFLLITERACPVVQTLSAKFETSFTLA